jgi:hypothetical protein
MHWLAAACWRVTWRCHMPGPALPAAAVLMPRGGHLHDARGLSLLLLCWCSGVGATEPSATLRAALPVDLRGGAAVGAGLRLIAASDASPALVTPACKLPDQSYVYSPELCPEASRAVCRTAFGCRQHAQLPAGRCSRDDLNTLPATDMALWIKVMGGSRTSPTCEVTGKSTRLTRPSSDSIMAYTIDGVIFFSTGLPHQLSTTRASSVMVSDHQLVRLSFSTQGRQKLAQLIQMKCHGNVACGSQVRHLVGRGYDNAQQAVVAQARSMPQTAAVATPTGSEMDTTTILNPGATATDISRIYQRLRTELRGLDVATPLTSRADPALPYAGRASGWLFWIVEVHLPLALPAGMAERRDKEVRAAVMVLLQTLAGDGKEAVQAYLRKMLADIEGAGVTVIRVTKDEADAVTAAYQDWCDEIRVRNQLPQRRYTELGAAHEKIMARLASGPQAVPLVIGGGGRWPLRFCRSWTESRKAEDERLNHVSRHVRLSTTCGETPDTTGASLDLDFLTRGPGNHSFLAMYQSGVLQPVDIPTAVVLKLGAAPVELLALCDSSSSHATQQEELKAVVVGLLSGKVPLDGGGYYSDAVILQQVGRVRYHCDAATPSPGQGAASADTSSPAVSPVDNQDSLVQFIAFVTGTYGAIDSRISNFLTRGHALELLGHEDHLAVNPVV